MPELDGETVNKEILEVLALLAERVRISSITRAKGFNEDTILSRLREVAQHAEQIEAILIVDYQVSQAQIDGLWAYVGHKGESEERGQFWRCTIIEPATRLRVGEGFAKTETEASKQALSMLKQRSGCHEPPALVSDGWGGH